MMRHVCMASLYALGSAQTGGPSSQAFTRIHVMQKLVSKTVSGVLFGPQRINPEMAVSHHPMLKHVYNQRPPASTWRIIPNLSLESGDFTLTPASAAEREICPYVGLPWNQRLHRDLHFLMCKYPADVKSSQCQRPQ